jgi:hypothetical protein
MRIYKFVILFFVLLFHTGCTDREKLKEFGSTENSDIIKFHTFFSDYEYDVKLLGAGGEYHWRSSGFLNDRYIVYLNFPIQVEGNGRFSVATATQYKIGVFDYGPKGLLNGEPRLTQFTPKHRTEYIAREAFSEFDSLSSLMDFLGVTEETEKGSFRRF